MLADLLIRPPGLTIDGAAWPILFDHAALLDLERLTGLEVLAGGFDLWKPTAKQLRAALFVALRRAGWDGSIADAGDLLFPEQLSEIHQTLIAGWIASCPREDDEAAEGEDESPHPKQTWVEKWAIARYDLRLSDEEWLAQTPRQSDEISRRYLISIRHSETMLARIAAEAANAPHYKRESAISARDFMLHPPPIKPQTIEDVLRATDHLPRTKESI